MTWVEFKRGVEARGVVNSDELSFIDWSSPEEINVQRDEVGENQNLVYITYT